MRYLFILLAFVCLIFTKQAHSQETDTLRNTTSWDAQWIGINILFDSGEEYGVYCFHKTITLTGKPSQFIIHVSADNHYKLYINGTLVSVGPARGDFNNWNYESIDISKYLKAGSNSVAAMVWNEADYRPEWQLTLRTGFILQGNTATEEVLNTNNSWKCVQDNSIGTVWGYFLAINGEAVDMTKAPTAGWNAAGFDDSAWPAAANLYAGQPKGLSDGFGYMLVPSPMPQREMTRQPITVVRSIAGATLPSPAPQKILPVTIPANKTVVIMFDQTYETNAFPTIGFSGGTGAGISMGYAESLYNPGSNFTQKGNRDSVGGQAFRGLTDTITSNGTAGQTYTPFNFRTYRYLRLLVHTKSAPLTIDSLYGTFTGYPFLRTAVFNADDPNINQMLDIGWRTARLNAYETFTDCPYYEQMQYIGDARVQAMISYYNSGDDRLARNALDLMDESRLPEGVTQSRYPTHTTQVIPGFSLAYIGMLYDYFMYRNDNAFLQTKLTGERAILGFFARFQGADGSLVNLPYWSYTDWATGTGSGSWNDGAPPKGSDGSSAIMDFQLLRAYQAAAAIEAGAGLPEYAALYNQKAAQLQQTIQTKYWNPQQMLYADTKAQNSFSQHANALALLTNMLSDSASALAFSQRLVADSASLTQCNYYFKYFLNQALVKGGLGDNYMTWLSAWRQAMAQGLTTWPEVDDLLNTRSDCHGWSASPNVEFFRTVLGIDSYAPGFQKVKIQPHLGTLTNVSGSIPSPNGTISVGYVSNNNQWKIGISLPPKTSGIFIWKGVTYQLNAGENTFVI
jgi:alpha-L-rhamnosidase